MEEIYIDGVNVAECEDFAETIKQLMPNGNIKEIEHYCFSANDECEGKDCYYKQLKRLEQENAELKEKLESYNCNANCYKYKEANKYKQALEEIRDIAGWHTTNKDSCDVQDDMKSIINKINEVLND